MRRILLMMWKMFFTWPIYTFRIWQASRTESLVYEEGFKRIKSAVLKATKAGRVTIDIKGQENIPQKQGFIYYPNHQGLFDVLVFLQASPYPFAFVMKKEVENRMFVRQVAGALGSLSIDREDLKQSLEVINSMAEKVQAGKNFIIFAEGTRNRNKNIPGEFKAGSFKAAVRSKCPIIPCALINSFVPFDEKHIRPVTVNVEFLKPIVYEEYKEMTTVAIAKEVKQRIVKCILSYEEKAANNGE